MPKIEIEQVRRFYDKESAKWYFSIADVIDISTESADPRNYWKVLKNRLKKTQNELVTTCNQLKMKAKDGKNYLIDVADEETILLILSSLPKATQATHSAFKYLLKHIEVEKGEVKLLIDRFQTESGAFIIKLKQPEKKED